MSTIIRRGLINETVSRACSLTDYNIRTDMHKQFEFRGFSEIYTARWINGYYKQWDSKNLQLKRFGTIRVILKRLENVESASQSWYEEAKSHLTINNKHTTIVKCFAPEVINGKGYTFKSDIYSVAILMWEISTGYSPFIDYEHNDYELAMNIIDGMRPEIASDTPLEYKSLMKQCWDDNPSNRLDIQSLREKMNEIHLLYQNMPNEVFQAKKLNNIEIKISDTSSRLFTSKIYQFDNLLDRKNTTEAIYSKVYDFSIPDNIDDFNNSSNLRVNKTSRISSNFKGINKGLSKVFKPLKISSKDDIRNDHKKVIMRRTKGSVNDDDEIHNNPNLHSEDQDEFEIPEDGF
ncbi:kinase-like domain-containing protein [Rhizophagus irregularis DAOM 181602=DAOM 197198]|nr:kinase-like domain-containing protein [Rhizophagus irregularis DAOM 181602=DAOM 197198]